MSHLYVTQRCFIFTMDLNQSAKGSWKDYYGSFNLCKIYVNHIFDFSPWAVACFRLTNWSPIGDDFRDDIFSW